jgi:hypothetical protein
VTGVGQEDAVPVESLALVGAPDAPYPGLVILIVALAQLFNVPSVTVAAPFCNPLLKLLNRQVVPTAPVGAVPLTEATDAKVLFVKLFICTAIQSAVAERVELNVLHFAGPLAGMAVLEVVMGVCSLASIITQPVSPLSTTVCMLCPVSAA